MLLTVVLNVHAADRVVMNAMDSGSGSLRAAVAEAAEGDSVRFHSALSGQTITLYSGPIVIGKSLSIDASALPKGVVISSAGLSRIFEIAESGSVALRSLSLRDGHAPNGVSDPQGNGGRGADGGAIYNAGALTLSGCALCDNSAGNGGGRGLARAGGGGNGGAIFNRGSMALSNCTLGGNSAGSRGAGSTGFDGFGSAIYNAGTASLSACTIAGNSAPGSAPAWAGFDAGKSRVAPSPDGVPQIVNPAPQSPALAPIATVYLSPTGSDTNAGTRAAPLRTADAALGAIGGEGAIVLLAGDYHNLRFNLATAGRLTIRADSGAVVGVLLGEKVTAFTHDSGIVWKAVVAAGYDFTETDNRLWIFEWGTPEGPIPPGAAQPLQRGRTHRLSHARLVHQATKGAVGAGPGRYWYDSAAHTLYVSATDGGNPNGRDYWIPSQTALQSMVFGGTASTDVAVEGVQVFFGRENLDLSLCRSYIVRSCLLYGASNEGIAANSFGQGLEDNNEYAANANDGSGPSTYGLPWSSLTVIDAWAHDNGDEGHSIHRNVEAAYFGGLFEYNKNGGITPAMGAKFTAFGPYTRGNAVGVYPAVTLLNPPVGIIAISATDPAVVTTAGPHGLDDGEMVRLADVIGSLPDINGDRVATVLGPNTFSVPLSQTVISTGGTAATFIGTSGTVCNWVSNADYTGAYNPTVNGVLKLIRPTVISPLFTAFNSGIGSMIEAYDPVLFSVVYPTSGAGTVHLINGAPIPCPVSESGTGLFTAGHLEIGNSIVAGNFAGNFASWGSMTDLGSNLTEGDPLLSPFGDFGGPTPTMALLPGSPARNAALTATTPTDQRGFSRPIGAPDIGASEAGNASGFRAWSFENLPGNANHGFSDDHDADGNSDGLEYALRSDPLAPNGSLISASATRVLGQPMIEISFPFRAAARDLIYIVERTADLSATAAWQEILRFDLSIGLLAISGGVSLSFGPLTHTLSVLDTGATPLNMFWRLRIEQTGASD